MHAPDQQATDEGPEESWLTPGAGLQVGHARDSAARVLQALHELSASAGRALDPADLVKLAANRACELLRGDAVALYIWDEGRQLLVPLYSNDAHALSVDRPLRPGEGAAGQAVVRREAVLVPDYAGWQHAAPWSAGYGLRAVVAVPLLVADRSIGALVVRYYTAHEVSPEEHQILALLAAQVAPALEAARLYATTHVEGQHERALREITQALAANLDERRVLELAVKYGAELLAAPYARVWLIAPGGELTCAAAEGFVHAETFSRRLARDSPSGRAARQQIVNLEDAPQDASWAVNREFGERTGMGAYLGAGLWRAGQSLGVIEVMRQRGRRFGRADEQLLVSLASAVAVAVSNARTHAAAESLAREAERRAAELAQSELLLRSIYEAIGSGVLVFDSDGVIITANAAAAEVLGRPVASLLGMRSNDFPDAVHEDGQPLADRERAVPAALRTRQPQRRVVFRIGRPDGQHRWLQVDAVPLLATDGSVKQVVASFIDITERKLSEEALHQRDAILESVASAAERLLTATDWEDGIEVVLRQLGAATGAGRVYIVPGHADARGQPHEWVARGLTPRAVSLSEAPYLQRVGLARWEAVLREGGIIQGRQVDFADSERAVLAVQEVSSILVVPIFAGGVWWGFVGFDDCQEERSWPSGAVEVVRTAAGTLGAAIERRRAEAERLQLVREQSARAEAEAAQARLALLAAASHVLAWSLDYEQTLRGVAEMVVPTLADYCAIDMLDSGRGPRRVAEAPPTATHSAAQRSL
ncbi:MAG: GAF domain-containing protein, partial [Chloroflexota bacterium]|nr:GAF domain-containing protein [Chloroflexota bacterium]